jgi:hypothetical protein
MRNWLFALMALMACGLIAAGCGDDDDDSGDTTATTTAAEETTDDGTEETDTEDSDTDATGSTPDDVYNACKDALEEVGADEFVETGCAGARDVFEQCIAQAEEIPDDATREQVLEDCQLAADETVEGLESGTPPVPE